MRPDLGPISSVCVIAKWAMRRNHRTGHLKRALPTSPESCGGGTSLRAAVQDAADGGEGRASAADYLRHRPGTIKYFVKAIAGESPNRAAEPRWWRRPWRRPRSASRRTSAMANNRLGDLAAIACAARSGTVHEIEARLFHPMDFMLAKPLDAVSDLTDPENWWVEDKYDGIRSQVHVENGRVDIFTRGMDEVTAAFPEITEAIKSINGEQRSMVRFWRGGTTGRLRSPCCSRESHARN